MKLIIKNITKNYRKKTVFKDVNIEFEEGKIYGLLGVNGSGKTTFFDCINNDKKITKGECYLEKEDKKIKITKSNTGYVKSIPSVPDFLTAREFIEFYLEVNEFKIPNCKTADKYMDDFYIDDEDRDKLLIEFSHGMKNKVLMLINFITKPDILLLDEPMTSFDPLTSENMKKKLRSIRKNKVIILSTHIMDIALDICDEIILIKNGEFMNIDNVKLGKVKSQKLILKHMKEIEND